MGLSQVGAIPKNQLDALPLYSAASATTGGTISVGIAGGFTRFFSPTVLGVSAANFAADGNGFITLATNFIDITGCRSFALILTRTNAGVGIALAGINIRIQYRLTSVDVPPTSLGALSGENFLGSILVNGAAQALIFPAMQAGGEVQRSAVGWDLAAAAPNPGAGAAFLTTAMIGDNCRLLFYIGSGADPGVANLFSATLWASS